MTGRLRERARNALCLALILALGRSADAGELASPGCLHGGQPGTISAIGDALDLHLADGRDVQLPGLDPVRVTASRPGGVEEARAVMQAWLLGRSVRVAEVQSGPDRWGRTLALVFANDPAGGSPDAPAVSVAEAMLDAGLARARPDQAIALCWGRYLTLEAAARQAGVGLWNDPSYRVVLADDVAALGDRAGGMTVVEGRMTEIYEGHGRTYLHMNEAGRSPFSATIEKRVMLRFAKGGIDPKTWLGKHLRVRGFLDDRFGLQIEISSPDQVEILTP